MDKSPIILAIESSCDDTAVAIAKDAKILAELSSSEEEIYQKYGGVVPELASRSHQKILLILVKKVFLAARISQNQISAVAATLGPGLLGSLLVGSSFAKSLAMAYSVPFIGVNHLQGHIMAHFISGVHKNLPTFPFLALIISGGNTQLVQVNDFFQMKILGTTLDDAVGEAFDKIAKIWHLGYPGGPLIDFHAKKGKPIFKFSKPKVKELDFSFSGLKTHVLYFTREQTKKNPDFVKSNLADLCASLQEVIAEILLEKVRFAFNQTKITQIALCGGVSANSKIREIFEELALKNNYELYLTPLKYAVDNAAMIARVAELKYKRNDFDLLNATPRSKWNLEDL